MQRRLAAAAVADEGDVPDAVRLVHACAPLPACGAVRAPTRYRACSRASVRPRAQPQHGLRVQLRDARLGDAEDLADLAQGEVLVVVEGDHELLALGQAARSRRRARSLQVALVERRRPGRARSWSAIVSSSET